MPIKGEQKIRERPFNLEGEGVMFFFFQLAVVE
jgi:hypothetical protein